jgi:streptomycin 6-kinase
MGWAAMTARPPALRLPAALVSAARRDGAEDWLDRLPALAARVAGDWGLTLGPPFEPGGQAAWVAPARRRDGADLVLKLGRRHPEAEHEAAGLQAWGGDGAVHLHADAEHGDTLALLLERCRPGDPLSGQPEEEQDEVVAGLLRRLWRPPPDGHGFPTLAAMCATWAAESEAELPRAPDPLDPGLVRDGLALFRELPGTADRHVLLCTDLHAGNVLDAGAGGRARSLVIDPKPHVGDPTYDALQHMLNCPGRLDADPRALVDRLAGLLGPDADHLARWLFARCVQEAPHWPTLAPVARRLAAAGL